VIPHENASFGVITPFLNTRQAFRVCVRPAGLKDHRRFLRNADHFSLAVVHMQHYSPLLRSTTRLNAVCVSSSACPDRTQGFQLPAARLLGSSPYCGPAPCSSPAPPPPPPHPPPPPLVRGERFSPTPPPCCEDPTGAVGTGSWLTLCCFLSSSRQRPDSPRIYRLFPRGGAHMANVAHEGNLPYVRKSLLQLAIKLLTLIIRLKRPIRKMKRVFEM